MNITWNVTEDEAKYILQSVGEYRSYLQSKILLERLIKETEDQVGHPIMSSPSNQNSSKSSPAVS